MAGKRKPSSDIIPIGRNEILETISAAEIPLRDKALISMVYLTGGRVCEIVPNKKRGWRGLTLGQLELVTMPNEKNIFLIKNLPTEKRKKLILRNIPIEYEREKPFIDVIDKYCGYLYQADATVLFPITRQRAWQIIKKVNPEWWLHLLRHWRFTDLAVNKDLKDSDLKLIAGWSDTRPAEVYVHMQWQDVARKLVKS